jgi:hypothetical protein
MSEQAVAGIALIAVPIIGPLAHGARGQATGLAPHLSEPTGAIPADSSISPNTPIAEAILAIACSSSRCRGLCERRITPGEQCRAPG